MTRWLLFLPCPLGGCVRGRRLDWLVRRGQDLMAVCEECKTKMVASGSWRLDGLVNHGDRRKRNLGVRPFA